MCDDEFPLERSWDAGESQFSEAAAQLVNSQALAIYVLGALSVDFEPSKSSGLSLDTIRCRKGVTVK